MAGKMHKFNEKRVKDKKDYKRGEPVPGTGIDTKRKHLQR